jgi:hypothetical protein
MVTLREINDCGPRFGLSAQAALTFGKRITEM